MYCKLAINKELVMVYYTLFVRTKCVRRRGMMVLKSLIFLNYLERR